MSAQGEAETDAPPSRESQPVVGASNSAIPPVVRRVLAGLLLLFVAVRVVTPVKDPDTYWHITAGRLLGQTWNFVTTDPWGVGATLPWIYNQWLPQLLMSWVEDRLGLAGVVWLSSLGAVVVVGTVWWTCRRGASMLASAVVVALAILGMMGSLSPRPQLVTFGLTAVFVDGWLRTATDLRPRWWLVAVSWVWACSHGMWFLGAVVGVVVLVGMALERTHPPRRLARLALVPTLSLAAGAVTPVGPRLLSSPFQVSEVTKYIVEWQPASLSNLSLVAVLVLAAVPVLAGLRTRELVSWPVVLLLGLGLVLALLYLRTLPIAAVILAPLAARTTSRILPRERVARPERVLTAALAVTGLVLAALLAATTASKPGSGPNDLDAQISALPDGTVLCNEWGDGGWFIWGHPNVRVTMDSRVEIYSTGHIEAYRDFLRAAPGWQQYARALGCDYALLPTDEPVVEALIANARWSVVATGADHVLLRAPQ